MIWKCALGIAALVVSTPLAQSQPAGSGASAGTADRCVSTDGVRSDNEVWTTNSWAAYNARDYQGASANVNACLAKWNAGATRVQQSIDAAKTPCPPVGAVDIQTRTAINQNGVLNDVGTNYWILAHSQESLGNDTAAAAAYASCARLTCARTWDTRGWFWSPAEECSTHGR